MPDRSPPSSKAPASGPGRAPASTPSARPSGGTGQRDLSAVAADLAIQQENEGLRLALREQERIVEELTNECRRLEDRLEDRYQDIDALRRELDKGERERKQAETQSSQPPGEDQGEPMGAGSGAGSEGAAGKGKQRQDGTERPAGRSWIGFAGGTLTGTALALASLAGLWFTGWITLTGDFPGASAPDSTAAINDTRTAPPDTVGEIDPMSPGLDHAAPAQETPVATTQETATDTPAQLPAERPDPAAELAAELAADLADQDASPEVEAIELPLDPVAGTHVDAFIGENATAPEMIVLNPAQFMMGNPVGMADSDARPVFRISHPGFMISKHEVTFTDYDRFVRATGARRPLDHGWGRGSRPVVDVSWNDALAYTQWLSTRTGKPYRLPSEAEWEYAARGGTSSSYWWGISPPDSRALCINCGTRWDRISTAPVGSFPPNPFGLHDTAGNAYEWTADCYHHNYRDAPSDGSAREEPGCQIRVARGGSFRSPASTMRSHARNRFAADARADTLGFRVARDLDPAP